MTLLQWLLTRRPENFQLFHSMSQIFTFESWPQDATLLLSIHLTPVWKMKLVRKSLTLMWWATALPVICDWWWAEVRVKCFSGLLTLQTIKEQSKPPEQTKRLKGELKILQHDIIVTGQVQYKNFYLSGDQSTQLTLAEWNPHSLWLALV